MERKGKFSANRIFPYLFAVGLVCRLVFVFGTPDFYAPDEQSHYKYVSYIAEHRSLPVQKHKVGHPANDWEYYQPPLYYIAIAPVFHIADAVFDDDYYMIRSLRLVSVLLWIGTVACTLRFLKILSIGSEFLKIVVLSMICLLPAYSFISAMINNDNLIILISSLLICSVAKIKTDFKSSLLTGFLLGLALLTKLNAGILLIAIVLILTLHVARGGETWQRALKSLLTTAIVSAALWIPWVMRNVEIYGSITAAGVANVQSEWPSLAAAFVSTMGHMAKSFWAVAGIHNNVGQEFSSLGILLSVLSSGGLIFVVFSAKQRNSVFGNGIYSSFMFVMMIVLILDILLVLRFGFLYAQSQGRFLFPLLLPAALLFGIGLRTYPVRHAGSWAAGIFIIYSLTFTFFSIAWFLRIL